MTRSLIVLVTFICGASLFLSCKSTGESDKSQEELKKELHQVLDTKEPVVENELSAVDSTLKSDIDSNSIESK